MRKAKPKIMRDSGARFHVCAPSRVGLAIICCGVLQLNAGCSQMAQPDRAERMKRGYVFYLDGAGGGSALSNWGGGLKTGLLDAGYDGAGEIFNWNTGQGVVADQDASVEYKRGKARECAQRIQQYSNDNPSAPVTLVGLSAGTAVTVFTLEALPMSSSVENVILCGASISADYDLTRALQRVRNRMYVFTSEKDAVLAFAVPFSGTADRTNSPSAGIRGFQMPMTGSSATRAQYAKLTHIGWKREFERYGDFGGHTDALKAPFVQQYMAPLIMAGMARKAQVTSAGGMVRNPDYQRWARFNPGSFATFEGYQVANGRKQMVRMTATLVSKHDDRLVVERNYEPLGDEKDMATSKQQFLIEAEVNSKDHPLSSPNGKITDKPSETVKIAGKLLKCTVKSVQAHGTFPEWGSEITATLVQNDTIPGGMAKVWLKSYKGDQPFEFSGDVVAFRAR